MCLELNKFLSDGSVGLLRVHENTTRIIPGMDKKQYNLDTLALYFWK